MSMLPISFIGGIIMAVYSERNDAPFVTKSIVKTTRKQGEFSKQLSKFMSENEISVRINDSHIIINITPTAIFG